MGEEVIIIPVMFLTIFGIVYYYLITRNKERLALIEAGADAKLFKSNTSNNWHIVIVLGMLAIGIALGIGLGFIVDRSMEMGHENDGAYVFGIFLFSGLSLLASFFLIRKVKKLDKE
ncbi:MAG: hypothetical protein OEW67_07635 [Cyclobacteriaceae bacterium]|nr:hypothetical protein [Cyclobacteriaceae bacterium]